MMKLMLYMWLRQRLMPIKLALLLRACISFQKCQMLNMKCVLMVLLPMMKVL